MSVIVVVKVPVIPNEDVDEFHLFQHLQLPVLHAGHLMEITAREEMLAINKDRSKFITLSNAEVHACNRVGVQFLCLSYPWRPRVSRGGVKKQYF